MIRPEEIKNIEPTVSMKLSEYNSLMKYLGVLETTLPEDYQLALEALVTENIKRITHSSNFMLYKGPLEANDIQQILTDHKFRIDYKRNGEIKVVRI